MANTFGQSHGLSQQAQGDLFVKRVVKRLKIQKHRGAVHRNPSGGTLKPSGLFSGNASAYDLAVAFALKKGLKVGSFNVGFGSADESQIVWLYFEESTVEDTVGIRWNEKEHRFSFSLAYLFEEVPTLRPSARQSVTMTEAVDDKGVACLAINLQGSLDKAVRANKKTGETGTGSENAK